MAGQTPDCDTSGGLLGAMFVVLGFAFTLLKLGSHRWQRVDYDSAIRTGADFCQSASGACLLAPADLFPVIR